MALKGYDRDESRCVLCGKSREQVKKLILGVHGGVCAECIDLCGEIIRGEQQQESSVEIAAPTAVEEVQADTALHVGLLILDADGDTLRFANLLMSGVLEMCVRHAGSAPPPRDALPGRRLSALVPGLHTALQSLQEKVKTTGRPHRAAGIRLPALPDEPLAALLVPLPTLEPFTKPLHGFAAWFWADDP